jgi:hypothetical protein
MPNLGFGLQGFAPNSTFGVPSVDLSDPQAFNSLDALANAPAPTAPQLGAVENVDPLGMPLGVPNVQDDPANFGHAFSSLATAPQQGFVTDPGIVVTPPLALTPFDKNVVDPFSVQDKSLQNVNPVQTFQQISMTPQKGFLTPPTLNIPFMQNFEFDKEMEVTPQVDKDPFAEPDLDAVVAPQDVTPSPPSQLGITPPALNISQQEEEAPVTPDLSFSSPMLGNVAPQTLGPNPYGLPENTPTFSPPSTPPPNLSPQDLDVTPAPLGPMSLDAALNATLAAMNPSMTSPDEGDDTDGTTGGIGAEGGNEGGEGGEGGGTGGGGGIGSEGGGGGAAGQASAEGGSSPSGGMGGGIGSEGGSASTGQGGPGAGSGDAGDDGGTGEGGAGV